MTANDAQSEFWEALAPDWLVAESHSTTVAGPFGRAAMDRLAPQPGQRVLDIGCGSGPTTIDLAHRVAPDGTARGVDIAPSLVAAARDRAASERVENATFAVADAQDEDFGDGAFDAAFSRFGIMFFADPGAAFANIRRSLAPAGRFAFACWQPVFANEWMLVPGVAAAGVTGQLPPLPGPDEPGPFSLADPERVDALLGGAGFTDIDVTPLAEPVVFTADRVDLFAERSQRIGVVREALRTADAETAARISEAVRTALHDRVVDGRLELSAGALIVSATQSV
jgi:SAM-dependent methyltransferase